MSQIYEWPSASASANPSVGSNSVTAPTSSTQVAGVDGSGNLVPLHINASNELLVAISAVPLPTGAATAANQVLEIAALNAISAQLPSTIGQKVASNSLSVVLASDQSTITVKAGGKSSVGFVRNDYTSVNVTTGAYVELIASTASAASELFIFDSSGQTLYLAFGGSGSEVNQLIIVPGGNGTVPLTIPAGTRISIKAISATANAGEIDINLLG